MLCPVYLLDVDVVDEQKGFQVFIHLKKNGSADAVAYNAAMTACSNANEWMQALIDALAKKSEWSRAVASLNTTLLNEQFLQLGHFDLAGAAVASCQEAQWEVALYLWEMARHGLFPTAAAHCLLLALQKAGL
eukprot:Skav226522  [mRNA]  locus=scaffold1773:200595:201882:- [translate_table: standard]